MFLRKPLIKTLILQFHLKERCICRLFSLKLLQIYKRYGVDVSDDVITPKAIRCANDKIFWCFDISEPTSDLLQNDLKRKSSLIIITDVNMTSKRAFLQIVTFLLNSTTKKLGFI